MRNGPTPDICTASLVNLYTQIYAPLHVQPLTPFYPLPAPIKAVSLMCGIAETFPFFLDSLLHELFGWFSVLSSFSLVCLDTSRLAPLTSRGFESLPTPDEEDEEEEEEEEDETPGETGPKVLTEIVEDKAIGQAPAWTARTGSQFNKRNAIVFVRSTAWPGAVCVAWGSSNACTKFANFYVGYGTKYTEDPFMPALPPIPQKEGVDMIETTDPTVEDEKELERQREEERRANEPEEGEEDEEGEEGEEEEEDGDYED